MTDRERLLQTLAATYAYYERELTEFAVGLWLEDLDSHPIDEVCAAFVRHRRDPQRGQWLPKSADILRQLQGDSAERAVTAWTHLLAEIRRVGAYGRPEIDETTREALATVGGWGAVCRADERELTWLQRRFAEAYGVHQARAERTAEPLLAAVAQALRLQ